MNAHQELLNLFQEWKALTEMEGQAIRDGQWTKVSHCQDAKFKLQSRIVMAHELLQSDLGNRGQKLDSYDPNFRNVVAELIQLEQRNGEWLDDQRRQAEEQQNELTKTSRNLRQMHRAYVPKSQAAWNSYS